MCGLVCIEIKIDNSCVAQCTYATVRSARYVQVDVGLVVTTIAGFNQVSYGFYEFRVHGLYIQRVSLNGHATFTAWI
jgi:hypothetical protein